MASSISAATSLTSAAMASAQSRMTPEQMAAATKAANDADKVKNLAKIDKTAQDFEAVFVTEMLKPMFNMVKVDPEFGGGKGEEMFRDLTLNEYGKKLASQGGFGIAPHIKEQLIRMQEQAAHPHADPAELAKAIKEASTVPSSPGIDTLN